MNSTSLIVIVSFITAIAVAMASELQSYSESTKQYMAQVPEIQQIEPSDFE